jgi:hypothetical protein
MYTSRTSGGIVEEQTKCNGATKDGNVEKIGPIFKAQIFHMPSNPWILVPNRQS